MFGSRDGRPYLTATRIPFGNYRINISHDNFCSAEREVAVFQEETLVVMALGVLPFHGSCYYRVTGRVIGDRLPFGMGGFCKDYWSTG
jgi:hypothetical protein